MLLTLTLAIICTSIADRITGRKGDRSLLSNVLNLSIRFTHLFFFEILLCCMIQCVSYFTYSSKEGEIPSEESLKLLMAITILLALTLLVGFVFTRLFVSGLSNADQKIICCLSTRQSRQQTAAKSANNLDKQDDKNGL